MFLNFFLWICYTNYFPIYSMLTLMLRQSSHLTSTSIATLIIIKIDHLNPLKAIPSQAFPHSCNHSAIFFIFFFFGGQQSSLYFYFNIFCSFFFWMGNEMNVPYVNCSQTTNSLCFGLKNSIFILLFFSSSLLCCILYDDDNKKIKKKNFFWLCKRRGDYYFQKKIPRPNAKSVCAPQNAQTWIFSHLLL